MSSYLSCCFHLQELMKVFIGFIDVARLYFALTQLTHRNISQNHKFQAVGLGKYRVVSEIWFMTDYQTASMVMVTFILSSNFASPFWAFSIYPFVLCAEDICLGFTLCPSWVALHLVFHGMVLAWIYGSTLRPCLDLLRKMRMWSKHLGPRIRF